MTRRIVFVAVVVVVVAGAGAGAVVGVGVGVGVGLVGLVAVAVVVVVVDCRLVFLHATRSVVAQFRIFSFEVFGYIHGLGIGVVCQMAHTTRYARSRAPEGGSCAATRICNNWDHVL